MIASASWEGIECEEVDAELAAQARAQAQTTATPANKEVLLRMSEAYERLAASAAKREGDKKGADDGSQ